MADIAKPDMSKQWANSGNKTPPSDSLINNGWNSGDIPTHTDFNYIDSRQDQGLAYLLQKGVPEWDSSTEYQAGKAFVQYGGKIYKCLQTATNKQPNLQAAYWQNQDSVKQSASLLSSFNSTGAADGDVYFFTGVDTVADDRGGAFYFSASSTATPNNGTIFAPTGGGRLYRLDIKVVTPQMFGADPKYKPSADNMAAVQLAADYLAANGGGVVYAPSGVYLGPQPLVLQSGVSLVGESRESTVFRKTGSTTKSLTIYAGSLVVYNNNPLPSAINACVALTGSGGRYKGRVTDITLEGVYATAGNYESQVVEFGIVSTGSLSDFTLERTYINATKYGVVIPDVFASTIRDNRISECLQAIGIDNGTSLTYTSNYANNCRDSHFIRSLKYSGIRNNAADYTNDPAKYPDRTKVRFAYRIRSLIGCDVSHNGNEQTWGRSIWMETLDNCTVKNNVTIGVGSDYVGTEHIAVLYSDGVLRGCTVKDNIGYDVKAGGLVYGGANASKHHNIYFEDTTFTINSEISGNIVRTTLTGTPTEAGWSNNVPLSWVNGAKGGDIVSTFSPTLTANTVGDLSVTYNSGNKHYRHDVGNLYHVFGCFDVTLTHTTASSYLIFQGFPANQNITWKIPITGVEGGSGLAKKLGSFRLNSGGGDGISFDENDGLFLITDIPTGTTLQIYYDGWYAKA